MNLDWQLHPLRGHPDGAYRCIADADTLARLGGAPCFSNPLPGQIAYVIRERGCWVGHVEIKAYHSVELCPRRNVDDAKAQVEALIKLTLGVKANRPRVLANVILCGETWRRGYMIYGSHAEIYIEGERHFLTVGGSGLWNALDWCDEQGIDTSAYRSKLAERDAIDQARALPRHQRPGLAARFRLLEVAAHAAGDGGEWDKPAFAHDSAMQLIALESAWPAAALAAS